MIYPNLKAEMSRHGITTDDVASTMGVSRRTVSNWFNGPMVRYSTALAIRNEMFPDLSLEYLFDVSPQTASAPQRSV